MESTNSKNEEMIKPGINSNTQSSIKHYFNFYSQLGNQQGMILDIKRTKTYYNSIVNNKTDIKDKIIMDVGTGTGILAIFCALNGAKKVYAVEASESIKYASELIKSNNLSDKIILINKKLEEITKEEIKEEIDLIISEPLGILLLNERMIETLLIARDKFLSKKGNIFPTNSTIHFIPFSDEFFYNDRVTTVQFWKNTNFYGINFNSLYEFGLKEKFSKPVIDAYNPCIHCCSQTCNIKFDFLVVKAEDLINFKVPLNYKIDKPCVIHGIAGWFDSLFIGSTKTILLSTSPYTYTTHWYQVRFFFKDPIAVNKGQSISGSIDFKGHNEQSYFININIKIDGTSFSTEGNYNLKDTEFWGLARYNGKNTWAIDDKIEETKSIFDTVKSSSD